VPYQIDGYTNAKINDPTTWATFDDAYRALASPKLAERGFGIGLVLGDGFSGIDLDHVRNAETGELVPWAFDLIMRLGSYTEISPSGTGLHILFEEAAGGAACKLGDKTTREGFEYYAGDRFFTVTGVPYELSAADIYPVAPEVRAAICAEMHVRFGKEEKAVSAQHRGHDGSPPRDDADVLRIAFAAKNGEEMAQLYHGVGPTVGAGTDASEADWALAKMLAFYTGRNREQIERLMRASGRYRRKWDEPRGDSTLLARTIEKACNVTEETYGMGWNGSANGRASHSNGAADKSTDAGTNGATHNARSARTAEFMSVGQLLSEPEDEQSYVVEGMLGCGSTALVSAKPKVGKTTWLLFLALCVVRGLQFFGRRVKRGAVLYVALVRKHQRMATRSEGDGVCGRRQIFHLRRASATGYNHLAS